MPGRYSSSRTTLVRGLSRSGGGSRPRSAFRGTLVASQLSLAVVLVVMALLFTRTLRNLAALDLGLDPTGVTAVMVQHPDIPVERRQLAEAQLLEAVRALPETLGAATTRQVPLSGESWNGRVVVDGVQRERETQLARVSAGYFETLRIGLVSGRDFTAADALDRPRVAVVNESFVRDFLDRKNPLGATFQLTAAPGTTAPFIEVVGVVKDAKNLGLRDPFKPMAFFPVTQQARPPQYLNLLVRLANPAAVRTVAEVIGRLEPSAVLMTVPLDSQIADQTVRERLLAILSTTFASAAAALAMLGLYAIVSFAVRQRVQEIGIRVALGARSADVITAILRQGLSWSAVGVAAGLGIAAAVAPSARSLLFGLEPLDLPVFAGVAIAFTFVALAAAYVPARKATSIDPIEALRADQ